MARISQVYAREILDSRAFPTIETIIRLDTGQTSVTSVPTGASTGKLETKELRDGDAKRFAGKGVLKAIANVTEKIGPAIIGLDPTSQFDIDQKLIALDGSANKENLGANAILSVSQAVTKSGAQAAGISLFDWINRLAQAGKVVADQPTRVPTPVFNMINGGLHGAGNLDFQEFQVIPSTAKPF